MIIFQLDVTCYTQISLRLHTERWQTSFFKVQLNILERRQMAVDQPLVWPTGGEQCKQPWSFLSQCNIGSLSPPRVSVPFVASEVQWVRVACTAPGIEVASEIQSRKKQLEKQRNWFIYSMHAQITTWGNANGQTDFRIGLFFCQPGWALAESCAGWDDLREERGGKQNCPCEKTTFREGRRTLQGDTKSGDAYRYRGSRFTCSQQGAERDVATWDTDIAA